MIKKLTPQQQERIKRYLFSILVIMVMVLFISTLLFINMYIGKDIRNIQIIASLESEFKEKNLSFPFPDSYSQVESHIYKSNYEIYDRYFHLDLEEFTQVVNDKYYYSEDYNCKYWTYVWSKYWSTNKDKYNWELNLITTENHIFVIVSNSSNYCLLDQNNSECFIYT